MLQHAQEISKNEEITWERFEIWKCFMNHSLMDKKMYQMFRSIYYQKQYVLLLQTVLIFGSQIESHAVVINIRIEIAFHCKTNSSLPKK